MSTVNLKQVNPATQRTWFMVLAITVGVMTGLIIPGSGFVLDFILIFSFFLTLALIAVMILAKNISELQHLAPLMFVATVIKITITALAAKIFISSEPAGLIVSSAAMPFQFSNPFVSILIFALAVFLFLVICKIIYDIIKTAGIYFEESFPVQKALIEENFPSGSDPFKNETEKLYQQARFFIAACGAGRFIVSSVIIEILILVAAVSAAQLAIFSEDISYQPMQLAAAIWFINQLTYFGTTSALKQLTSKYCRLPEEQIDPDALAEKIKTDGPIQKSEPDIIFDYTDAKEVKKSSAGPVVHTETKWLVNDAQDWLWDYKKIYKDDRYAGFAKKLAGRTKNKCILMASESIKDLPVTLPVKIAAQLGRLGKKCLLIDLDVYRKAISQVFDIDAEANRDRVVETGIRNLSLWPTGEISSAQNLIAGADYDYVIVYTPKIKLLGDFDEFFRLDLSMVLFGNAERIGGAVISDLFEKALENNIEIIKPDYLLYHV